MSAFSSEPKEEFKRVTYPKKLKIENRKQLNHRLVSPLATLYSLVSSLSTLEAVLQGSKYLNIHYHIVSFYIVFILHEKSTPTGLWTVCSLVRLFLTLPCCWPFCPMRTRNTGCPTHTKYHPTGTISRFPPSTEKLSPNLNQQEQGSIVT